MVAEARTGGRLTARRRDPPRPRCAGLDKPFGVAAPPRGRAVPATGTGDPSGRQGLPRVGHYVVETGRSRADRRRVVRACRSETTGARRRETRIDRPTTELAGSLSTVRPRRRDQVQRPATFRDDLPVARASSPDRRPAASTRVHHRRRPSRPTSPCARKPSSGVSVAVARIPDAGTRTRGVVVITMAPGRFPDGRCSRAGVRCRVDVTACGSVRKRRPIRRTTVTGHCCATQIVDRTSRFPVLLSTPGPAACTGTIRRARRGQRLHPRLVRRRNDRDRRRRRLSPRCGSTRRSSGSFPDPIDRKPTRHRSAWATSTTCREPPRRGIGRRTRPLRCTAPRHVRVNRRRTPIASTDRATDRPRVTSHKRLPARLGIAISFPIRTTCRAYERTANDASARRPPYAHRAIRRRQRRWYSPSIVRTRVIATPESSIAALPRSSERAPPGSRHMNDRRTETRSPVDLRNGFP